METPTNYQEMPERLEASRLVNTAKLFASPAFGAVAEGFQRSAEAEVMEIVRRYNAHAALEAEVERLNEANAIWSKHDGEMHDESLRLESEVERLRNECYELHRRDREEEMERLRARVEALTEAGRFTLEQIEFWLRQAAKPVPSGITVNLDWVGFRQSAEYLRRALSEGGTK